MPRKASNKDVLAHQRMDDHEKLCRIMQEETNKQIKNYIQIYIELKRF